MRKKTFIFLIAVELLLLSGCSGEMATGTAVGTGVGALLQNTIAGAKADLKVREEALVKAYNEGVTIGMERKDLDAIAKELDWNRKAQQSTEVGEQFLGMNWNDPKQTSMAFGSMIELGLILWGGKKLKQTTAELRGTQAGVNKFCGTHEPIVAAQLHDVVKEKLSANRIRV